MINKSLFSSKDQTWETPNSLIDLIKSEFNLEVDVCAVPETAKCDKYFTPEDDGLKQDWKGICWLIPPYGREQIKWINKAYEETLRECKQVI